MQYTGMDVERVFGSPQQQRKTPSTSLAMIARHIKTELAIIADGDEEKLKTITHILKGMF